MVYLGLWLLQNISTLKCQKHYLWEDLRNRQEYATKCLGHIFSLCNIASRFSKLSKQKRLIFGKFFLNKHEHTPLFMDFVAKKANFRYEMSLIRDFFATKRLNLSCYKMHENLYNIFFSWTQIRYVRWIVDTSKKKMLNC